MAVLIGVFTLVCMGGAYVAGVAVLEFLTRCNLSDYRWLFVLLLFSGGINALAYLLYHVLTIFRDRIGIILGFGMASLVAFLISTRMTEKCGLWGAAGSYLVTISILLIIFIICCFRQNKQ